VVPVDCVISAFGPFGACSVSCGGGTQTATATVLAPAANGGKACPALTQEKACNEQACAVDCVVSAWGAFSACSVSCGGGKQQQSRKVTTAAANGGAACPELIRSQDCNSQPCPTNAPAVDCQVGAWGAWSACSASCGGGKQTSTRKVTTPSANGGAACPVLTQERDCNIAPCPVDCVISAFGAFGACSVACGGGTQTATATVVTASANDGAACPALAKTQPCNVQACPVDCVGAWSNFGACSATCGGGTQTQTYTIKTQAANGGAACPTVLEHTQACNQQACPVDCVGAWGGWGVCPVACGGGQQTRTYTVTTPAQNGGAACPATAGQSGTQACNVQGCPVACVGAWSAYGACSVSCGGGQQTRTFTITTQAANGGAGCPAANGQSQAQACNVQGCPVNCVGAWGGFGACSASCGGGQQTQIYTVTTAAQNGGAPCPAANGQSQAQACNVQGCPVNCVGSWGGWSGCSASCGGGQQTQTYTITTQAAFGGAGCPAANGQTQAQACNVHGCPVNCVGAWGGWSGCSASCGGGQQTQTYTVYTPAQNGGAGCPAANGQTNQQGCNYQACAQDCVMSGWSGQSACSKSCGGGVTTQTRTIVTPASNGGAPCGADSMQSYCNRGECPPGCPAGTQGFWMSTLLQSGNMVGIAKQRTPAGNGYLVYGGGAETSGIGAISGLFYQIQGESAINFVVAGTDGNLWCITDGPTPTWRVCNEIKAHPAITGGSGVRTDLYPQGRSGNVVVTATSIVSESPCGRNDGYWFTQILPDGRVTGLTRQVQGDGYLTTPASAPFVTGLSWCNGGLIVIKNAQGDLWCWDTNNPAQKCNQYQSHPATKFFIGTDRYPNPSGTGAACG